MSQTTLSRYRAERLLRRDFAGLRARVVSVVRARLRATGLALDQADLDACYATAWHGLYAAVLEGQQIDDPAAWLVVVTFRRAIDEGRARARQLDGGEAHPVSPVAVAAPGPDFAGLLDDRARLTQLFQALCLGLSPREREAVALCYLQGLPRSQAAARMGISEARMRKLMDGARGRPGVASRFAELAEAVGAGEWCDRQDSLMRAYAFGLLDPDGERHRLAIAHVRECPSCRARVACLRGLASVLPPLGLPISMPGLARRPRAHLAAAKAPGGTVVAKLAAIGACTALAGAGVAVLVSGAPAEKPRADATQTAVPPVVAGHRGGSRRHPRGHGRSRSRNPASSSSSASWPSARSATAPSSSAPSTSPSQPTRQRSPSRALAASGQTGEFTPERPAR